MEKILHINETHFKKSNDDWSSFSGYEIVTDKQIIKLGISDQQSCCENWGYFLSEDNFEEFINTNLLEIRIVDECLRSKKLEEVSYYEGSTMFVNLETTKGTLQFTAYNSHNGYYGHEAIVISNQLNVDDYL